MAGKPGMHKKAAITKDDNLSVASRTNGQEKKLEYLGIKDFPEFEADQEEKFLKDTMESYSYWRKQPGDLAKAYAAAYKTLINEFTAEETEK